MGRPSKFTEVDEVASFFGKGPSQKMIKRLLERAAQKQTRANAKAMRQATRDMRQGARVGKAVGGMLAKTLKQALSHHSGGRKGAASIKQTARDTGGRPFHFAHSVSTRSTTPTGGAANGGPAKTSKWAAKERYIEREAAVERRVELIAAETSRDALETNRANGEDREIEAPGLSLLASSATSRQRYIEDPTKVVKLATREQLTLSFGTIGETMEERIRFWEALDEAERNDKNGRVQNQFIVELPHETTTEARAAMLKRFCARFEDLGLPYWAAARAPGAKNDDRNFHAHIVVADRPAKKMVDPADGKEKWDFEIVERRRDSTRHWHDTRPHRQKKPQTVRDRQFIKKMRIGFAEDVNAILAETPAKDASGKPVVYDARSYKDMGIDVVPMKSINRIVADKAKLGKITVLDGDYTRRMTQQAIEEAARRRDDDVMALVKLEKTLGDLTRKPGQLAKANRALPKSMRMVPDASLPKSAFKAAATKVLEARRGALAHQVLTRSGRLALDRIVEATDPKVIRSTKDRTKDADRLKELPDPELADAVHQEAVEMRREFDAEMAAIARRLDIRVGQAINGWLRCGMVRPDPNASMRQAMALNAEATPKTKDAARPQGQPELDARETASTAQAQPKQPRAAQDTRERPSRATAKPVPPTPPRAPTAADLAKNPGHSLNQVQAYLSATLDPIRALPNVDDRIAAIDMLDRMNTGANAAALRRAKDARMRTEGASRPGRQTPPAQDRPTAPSETTKGSEPRPGTPAKAEKSAVATPAPPKGAAEQTSEEIEAKRLAAERKRKRRKALLSRSRGRGGPSRF